MILICVRVGLLRMKTTFYGNMISIIQQEKDWSKFKKLRIRISVDFKEILKRMKLREIEIVIKFLANAN